MSSSSGAKSGQQTVFFLDAMLVDDDLQGRANLKQAALAVPTIRKFRLMNTLEDTLTRLDSTEPCDVVFVSSEFGDAAVEEFLANAQRTFRGAHCSYVIVLKANAQHQVAVASAMLGGADAFLAEPYSVDRMSEIANIACNVKLNNMRARKRAAISLLISNIMKEFDKLSTYMSRGFNVDRAKKKFIEACSTLKRMQHDSLAVYCDLAIELFENATLPPVIGYGGVSNRVRQRLERKLQEQFEKEERGELSAANKFIPIDDL